MATPRKALSRLEKTIVIDSTNPYGYFYLAKTHYRLGRYKESLSFLDVAESRLAENLSGLPKCTRCAGEFSRSWDGRQGGSQLCAGAAAEFR